MIEPMHFDVGQGDSLPHWAVRPEAEWEVFEDFTVFMRLMWAALNLPAPTVRQLDIARRLQAAGRNSKTNDVIRAFRGIGKSFILCGYVLWRLMRNPRDEKVLVVSATGSKAKEFVAMAKRLLRTMPELAFLIPDEDQRDQADRFDVRGASIAQSHSLKAVGISGQITGGRATLIVADDIEIPANSKTEDARATLLQYTLEFEAVRMPDASDVIYLGTPQTEESIYNRLVRERGYSCYCVPARFPTGDKRDGYVLRTDEGRLVDILAAELIAEHDAGLLPVGAPTDPVRHGHTLLLGVEAKGRSFFALQYMLDTSLSDAERYPLKTADLVVFETNAQRAPLIVQWGRHTDDKNVVRDIANLGFQGDFLQRPLFASDEWRPYEGVMVFVDPSGRGKDETAWAVVAHLNGMLYLLHLGAISGDPTTAMTQIAKDAKRFNANLVEVEPNMGGGMWTIAFGPVLAREWPGGCSVRDSEWATGQKETRIIDTLEPVLTAHRLVVSESLLRADAKTPDRDYSFLYQLTHITRDRGALAHDDRVDALAGAVAHYRAAMGLDTTEAAKALVDAEREAAVADWEEGWKEGGLVKMRGLSPTGWGGERHEVRRWTPSMGELHYPARL